MGLPSNFVREDNNDHHEKATPPPWILALARWHSPDRPSLVSAGHSTHSLLRPQARVGRPLTPVSVAGVGRRPVCVAVPSRQIYDC